MISQSSLPSNSQTLPVNKDGFLPWNTILCDLCVSLYFYSLSLQSFWRVEAQKTQLGVPQETGKSGRAAQFYQIPVSVKTRNNLARGGQKKMKWSTVAGWGEGLKQPTLDFSNSRFSWKKSKNESLKWRNESTKVAKFTYCTKYI